MAITDWSTTASSNATADGAIDWQEGQNPSTVNNSARAMMAALKSWHLDLSGLALGGTGNTFTLTPAQPLASLTNAMYGFIADRANTGAVTLAVSGLTAKPLRRVSGTDLSANQILSGGYYLAAYDTSSEEWLLVGARSLANADLPSMNNNTVKANISGSTAVPSDVTIDNLLNAASANSVALSKLPTQADSTVLANVSGSTAVPSAVTVPNLIAEILTTRGDIIRRGSSAPERLAIGSNGQVLQSNGTDIAWATIVAVASVSGNAGKILTNNGGTTSWIDHPVFMRATVTLSGGTPTVQSSKNLASVVRQSTGVYRFTFSTAAASLAGYTVVGNGYDATYAGVTCYLPSSFRATSYFDLHVGVPTIGLVDPETLEVIVTSS